MSTTKMSVTALNVEHGDLMRVYIPSVNYESEFYVTIESSKLSDQDNVKVEIKTTDGMIFIFGASQHCVVERNTA